MRPFSIPQILKHTAVHGGPRSAKGLLGALKRAKAPLAKMEGDARGYRLTEREANKYIARLWPHVPPLSQPEATR